MAGPEMEAPVVIICSKCKQPVGTICGCPKYCLIVGKRALGPFHSKENAEKFARTVNCKRFKVLELETPK